MKKSIKRTMDKLTQSQTNKLTDLWFVFGNNGSKHDMRNHKFIQKLLDKNPPEDYREFYHPTKECLIEVDKVLFDNS